MLSLWLISSHYYADAIYCACESVTRDNQAHKNIPAETLARTPTPSCRRWFNHSVSLNSSEGKENGIICHISPGTEGWSLTADIKKSRRVLHASLTLNICFVSTSINRGSVAQCVSTERWSQTPKQNGRWKWSIPASLRRPPASSETQYTACFFFFLWK